MDAGTLDPAKSPPRTRATLPIASAATLLALMNYTAPTTVLADVARELRADIGGQTWILNGISLGLAALLLTAGSLADNYGRRRLFAIGSLVLAASSVLCAAAPTVWLFVVGRLVQGAASAALIAAGLGLVAHTYTEPAARARGTAVWSAMLGLGIALGPLVSALFGAFTHWRIFYVAVSVASVALAAGAVRWLDETRAERARRVDLPGMLTMTGAVALLVTALTLGRTGWSDPAVWVSALGALALLAAFGVIESRRPEPMLDLALLRRPAFVGATLAALVTGLSVIGLMNYFPPVLQQVTGIGPVAGALVFGIWAVTSFVVALVARRLSWSAGRQLVWGMVLAGVGELAMFGAAEAGSWSQAVPGLLVAGVASGVLNAALAGQAVATVPADRASMGSGANNTARYIGSSVGVAVVVAVVSAGRNPAHGIDLALIVSAATAFAGAVGIALLSRKN
ncbi:MFS transporter [Saccharopolyspora taberi]|uniref:MFS transporter n=1 Tax=Saccharopolyspora taberi TaxID=60895 RepID=A0ABN3VI34_9PSEU